MNKLYLSSTDVYKYMHSTSQQNAWPTCIKHKEILEVEVGISMEKNPVNLQLDYVFI